ncbi:MAG: GntR family transcriptional regulator [Kiritimatiellaeota bacterium]|nr:GntR family transcriptional regulator [Kiritimatiellota bacterium]
MQPIELAEKIHRRLIAISALHKTRTGVREEDLAGYFNVSRTPVREALRILDEKGLVERIKKAGTFLRIPSLKEIADIYDVRSVLDGLAAKLFCENATPEMIARLKNISKRHDAAMQRGKYDLADATDIEFHLAIASMCGNRIIARLINDSHLLADTFVLANRIVPFPHAIPKNTAYPHQRILLCFMARNPAQAEQIARCHVERAKDRIIRNFLRRDAQTLDAPSNKTGLRKGRHHEHAVGTQRATD